MLSILSDTVQDTIANFAPSRETVMCRAPDIKSTNSTNLMFRSPRSVGNGYIIYEKVLGYMRVED